MEFKEQFKLKSNPFRLTPATNSDELVWAGFPGIKEKFEKRIKRSIKLNNSSLVLNWGEYGSGKTHAARYFTKDAVLNDLKDEFSIPYSMIIPLPKGKEPVYHIFTSIVDKIKINEIRSKFTETSFEITDVIDKIGDNVQIQSILKAIFNDKIKENQIKKYLYGNISNKELEMLNEFGILRKLNSDSDYTKFISGLFSCLTHKKEIYSLMTIWIDEFEDIAVLSSSNIDKTNNFLREIMDNTPNNLLIFINLTQSTLIGVEDLGEYLYESVRSRIKEKNNFELPSKEAFNSYLVELLNLHSAETRADNYFPFEQDTAEYLIDKLENASLRRFNDAFSLLLELADMDNEAIPIKKSYLLANESDIIWEI